MEPISRTRLNDHLATADEAQKVAVATKEADKSGASYAIGRLRDRHGILLRENIFGAM